MIASPAAVLTFWREAGPKRWFEKDDGFDAQIRERFLPVYEAAAAGRLSRWEDDPESALALTIALDQFPRNMFRGNARSYAADAMARQVAGRALARKFDLDVPRAERGFFYLPLMHSEETADQERCCELYRALGDDNALNYALIHADIIHRFGRFPHRNAALGRATRPEEQIFLDSGGFPG